MRAVIGSISIGPDAVHKKLVTSIEQQILLEKALRILHLQRAMLLLGGPDTRWRPGVDDDNPPRFWEPLPSGPFKWKTLNRKRFEKERLEYFKAVGWDENGVPKPQNLRRLGLTDVEARLRETNLIT